MPMSRQARFLISIVVVALLFAGQRFVRADDDVKMPDLPDGLEIKLALPEMKPTRATVNTGFYVPQLELTNTSDAEMILWPFISIDVLKDDGTPAPPSMHIGR